MNKQQFLTELRGILSFMSEEDRDLTIGSFDTLFDSFGEIGENELLLKLGSPTKVAVELSRRYLSDGLEKALSPFGSLHPSQASEQAEEPHAVELADVSDADDPMQQLAQEVFSDLPAYELSEPENMELIPEEEPEDVSSEEAAEAPVEEDPDKNQVTEETPAENTSSTAEQSSESKPDSIPDKPAPQPIAPIVPNKNPQTPASGAEPWRAVKKAKSKTANKKKKTKSDLTGAVVPRGLGIPMFLFIMIVLGLPLAFLFLSAIIVLLVPGIAGIGCAYLTAVACLWSINYVADTILLIGLALVLLSVGAIVLMGGIWLDIQLFIVYKQAVGWLAGALIGRRRKQ